MQTRKKTVIIGLSLVTLVCGCKSVDLKNTLSEGTNESLVSLLASILLIARNGNHATNTSVRA